MKKSYPEEQLRRVKRRRRMTALKLAVLGTFTLFAASLILYHFYESLIIGINILFLGIVTLFLISILSFALMLNYLKPTKNEKQLKRGVEGERAFKNYLDKIDGNKFYSVPLPHGGDIDALLVSRNGVFAFEVKNYSGIIKCEGDAWQRTKIGKGGGRYEGHVGNPSEEARRHARDLQNYLRNRGLNVKIIPVVVITHPNAKLQCDRCSVKVIKPEQLKMLLRRGYEIEEWEYDKISKEIRRLISKN